MKNFQTFVPTTDNFGVPCMEPALWYEQTNSFVRVEDHQKVVDALQKVHAGLSSMVKTVKPLPNFSAYQVLNLSPTQLISLVNELLKTTTVE